jgi:putative transposase
MSHRRPPRLADSEYVGATRIFLTMCTFERRRYFASRVSIDIVFRQLLRTSATRTVEIIAYCFMPDHFHALVAGTSEGSNLHQFFQRFRQQSGFHHQSATGQRLWQDGYFDRSLRKEDDTFDVVSYILANPVRAGLCATAVDYQFSGSSRYSLEQIATYVQWRP